MLGPGQSLLLRWATQHLLICLKQKAESLMFSWQLDFAFASLFRAPFLAPDLNQNYFYQFNGARADLCAEVGTTDTAEADITALPLYSPLQQSQ